MNTINTFQFFVVFKKTRYKGVTKIFKIPKSICTIYLGKNRMKIVI